MKKIFFLFLIFVCGGKMPGFAQSQGPYFPNCLSNGNFYGACDDVIPTTSGPTFTDGCGAGWYRSHGTPQMVQYTTYYTETGSTPGYCAFMWYDNGGGEGIYTANTFQSGQNYDVRIVLTSLIENGGTGGTVYIYAANGLTEQPIPDPATTTIAFQIPSISGKQLIGTFDGTTTALTNNLYDHVYNFTANANYSQIWIYPGGSPTGHYDLDVLLADVCTGCGPTQYYNSGAIPAGTPYYGNIYAGSTTGSGGSGTVTVSPNQTTVLTAGVQIVLAPSFTASVTTGTFTAQINPCDLSTHPLSNPNITSITDSVVITGMSTPFNDSSLISKVSGKAVNGGIQRMFTTDTATAAGNDIYIYPTVSSGLVHLTDGSNLLQNADIMVMTTSGQVVYHRHNGGGSNVQLDLTSLNAGIYFIRISSKAGTSTQKIIIAH